MKRYKLFTIGCLMAAISLPACIDDDSDLGGRELPELSIAGEMGENMPLVEFNLGDDCVINPEISFKGDESTLTYEWSLSTYDETNGKNPDLKIVSEERNLNYKFESGGTYYAHLVVTDGAVSDIQEYRININRTYERGYIILSNTESGEGNMGFIKTLTQSEIDAGVKEIVQQHCLERMNPDVKPSKMVGSFVKTINLWDGSQSSTLNRLLVSDQDKCYFIDPNNFTILTTVEYASVVPGFKATQMFSDFYPYLYDASSKKYVHLEAQFLTPFVKENYKTHQTDGFYVSYLNAWGSVSPIIMDVDYETSEISEPFAYAPGGFYKTGTMFKGEDIVTVYANGESYPDPRRYVITRSKENPFQMQLHTMDSFGSLNKLSVDDFEVSDEYAIPYHQSMPISATYKRHFYKEGNCVYVLVDGNKIPFAKKNLPAIRFAETEEVTFITTDILTEQLYVGTFDSQTKKGNFYVYDNKEVRADKTLSAADAKESHKGCADRIVDIFYKPSIK